MNYSMREFLDLLKSNDQLAIDDPYIHQPVTALAMAVPVVKSEHDLQCQVIAECDRRALTNPRWKSIFAIPNGGHRSKAQGGKLKAEGVRAGVPDLFVARFRDAKNGHPEYYGAFLELKISPNKLSQAQSEWMRRLQAQGYFCRVVYDSVDEVLNVMDWYLR